MTIQAASLTPTSQENVFTLPDFTFNAGGHLPELNMHCTTLGQPQRDENDRVCNAVLILHGTGGSGSAFLRPQFADVLFGPGQLLDVDRYFVILPDGIGHGQSSKPSDGLRADFPKYGYRDMVQAQYRLLMEHLNVDHLRLVMGTSMGGMHTWLWGETYPDFMDALMPLASLPTQISGRNRMIRRMIIDSIQRDPAWEKGHYKTQPPGLRSAVYALLFMVSSPYQWQQQAPTLQQADALFDELVEEYLAKQDANDMLYHFRASEDYDPGPNLEQIKAPLTAINSADDQVNPPELGILEREIKRVLQGQSVLLPVTEHTRGHGTHSWPEIWQDHLAALLKRSER
ncbi:MAG: alpha/beta fold hydrolase [Chloroflexota bacterium]